jgi:hypothetical protein
LKFEALNCHERGAWAAAQATISSTVSRAAGRAKGRSIVALQRRLYSALLTSLMRGSAASIMPR